MRNSIQNPFPGIDPFVEAAQIWPDFHSRFMNVWCEAIADQLSENYVARLEEQLTVIEFEEERKQRRAPDIAILKSSIRTSPSVAIKNLVSTIEQQIEPQISRILIEEEVRQAYLEIRHLSDHRLVAVLELLSPTNKSGDGRTQYLAKRQQVLMSEAHLVELDLLIGSKPLPHTPAREGHFHAIVSRTGQRPNCEVYSWSLKQSMPWLPVPLLAPDPDLQIDLALVLATTYQRGRYWKTLKYDAPLELPLSDEYQTWVREQVSNPPAAESND